MKAVLSAHAIVNIKSVARTLIKNSEKLRRTKGRSVISYSEFCPIIGPHLLN